MKIKSAKQFATGLFLGLVLSVTVTAFAATKILSADYNDVTVTLNGQAIVLEQPLASVIDEENPGYFSNYMPLSTVLKQLGYTVTWDEESRNIDLSKDEQTAALAVTEADITVDGGARDWTISLIEVPREQGSTETFVSVNELLGLIETKEMPFSAVYDAATNTFSVTTKPPFAEGKPLREVLNATGYQYNVVMGENDFFTIELTSDDKKATATYNLMSEEPGKIVFGDASAEFAFYPSQGTTYIVEASFLQALEDVGFMETTQTTP